MLFSASVAHHLDGAQPGIPATEERDVAPDHAREAMAAVQVGLYVAAFRCLLTYVVAPAAGSIGIFLGPMGLGLQLLGAITCTAGARRLWRLGHRARVPYAAIAMSLSVLTAVTVVHVVVEAFL